MMKQRNGRCKDRRRKKKKKKQRKKMMKREQKKRKTEKQKKQDLFVLLYQILFVVILFTLALALALELGLEWAWIIMILPRGTRSPRPTITVDQSISLREPLCRSHMRLAGLCHNGHPFAVKETKPTAVGKCLVSTTTTRLLRIKDMFQFHLPLENKSWQYKH